MLKNDIFRLNLLKAFGALKKADVQVDTAPKEAQPAASLPAPVKTPEQPSTTTPAATAAPAVPQAITPGAGPGATSGFPQAITPGATAASGFSTPSSTVPSQSLSSPSQSMSFNQPFTITPATGFSSGMTGSSTATTDSQATGIQSSQQKTMMTPGSGAGVFSGNIPGLEQAKSSGRFLGEGEYASVYHFPGTDAAVKYIDPELMDDPSEISNEVDIAKELGDLGVSYPIHGVEYGETDEGEKYPSKIHMGYLEGYDNARHAMREAEKGNLTGEQLDSHKDRMLNAGLDLFRKSRDMSLKAGVSHNDLHPENIMIDKDGGVKIIDYGLASRNKKDALHELLLPNKKISYSRKALDWIGGKNPELASEIGNVLDEAHSKYNKERFGGGLDAFSHLKDVYSNIGDVFKKHGYELGE